MKKISFLLFVFLCISSGMYGQNVQQVITFVTDPNMRIDPRFENHSDTAFFYFDEGFTGDTISILIDNVLKFKGRVTSDAFMGFALLKTIPKTKRTFVTMKRNRQVFKSFEFNKNFSCIHLTYYQRKLSATYTNRLYWYN